MKHNEFRAFLIGVSVALILGAMIAIVLLLPPSSGPGESPIDLQPHVSNVSPFKLAGIGAHPGNKTQEKTARKDILPAPKSPPQQAPVVAPTDVFPRPAPLSVPAYQVQPGEGLPTIATKQGVPDAQKDAWINELLRLNTLLEARVQAGQVVKLPPVPVYIPQPYPQPQLVVIPVAPTPIAITQPALTAATPTKTPALTSTPSTTAATIATATATPKPANVPPTATSTKVLFTPTKTPMIATPTKTPLMVVATPTSVKPAIVLPTATPTKQALPTATKTPYAGNGGGPTLCNDGWVSPSSGSGTCSSHGGIKK